MTPGSGPLRALSIILIVAGAILIVAGVVTWFIVRDQLADEQIVATGKVEVAVLLRQALQLLGRA